jgi:hypothetical protein
MLSAIQITDDKENGKALNRCTRTPEIAEDIYTGCAAETESEIAQEMSVGHVSYKVYFQIDGGESFQRHSKKIRSHSGVNVSHTAHSIEQILTS